MALSEEKTKEEVTTAVEGEEGVTEEDCSPEFTPIVKLEEVNPIKGDEDEIIVWQKYSIYDSNLDFFVFFVRLFSKCKLYRFDVDVWKERGLGQAKILKHKTNNKQRFVMHEDKTLKLRANHLILPDTKLKEHGGNEKALVFSTIDFADEKQKEESFCIRFGTSEKAQEFRDAYENAIKENAQYLNSTTPTQTEDSSLETKKEVDEEAKEVEEKEEDSSEVEKLGDELQTKAVVTEETPSAEH
eukprot:g2065.t1